MTSTYDPYQDEDAVEIDLSTAYENSPSPFLKAFMHVGEAIKRGHFCAINVMKEGEKSDKSLANDTTMDMTVDDSQHEQVAVEKSVSFSDTEPLIVDDVTVPVDSTAQASEAVEVKSDALYAPEPIEDEDEDEEETSMVTEVARKFELVEEAPKTATAAKGPSGLSFVVVLVGILSVCVGLNKCGRLSTISNVLAAFSVWIQEASGVDLTKLMCGSSAALALLLGLSTFFGNEKRLKAFIEFVWGILICSVVLTGMYFTYDFTA